MFMARKILCIDVGLSFIKFFQLIKSVKGSPLGNIYEIETPKKPEESSSSLSKAIKDFIEEKELYSDDYVVSIPSRFILIREVKLPFRDHTKIRQVLKFEVEQNIPFQADETLVDFIVEEELSDGVKVLAFLVKKEVIRDCLTTFHEVGVDPKLITADIFPALGILRTNIEEMEKIIAHVEIGARHTVLNIFKDGKFKFSRTIMKAGEFITSRIQDALKTTRDEAEKLKIAGDFDILDSEPNPVGLAVMEGLSDILKEITYSINSFLAHHLDEEIDKLFLSGGSSAIEGLAQTVKEKIGIETKVLSPKPFFNMSSGETISPKFNLAIGMGVLGMSNKVDRINLRREEFSFKKIDKKMKANIKYSSVLVACILILFILNSTVSFYLIKRENEILKDQVMRIYREIVPQGKVVNEIAQAQQYIRGLNEESNKFRNVLEQDVTPLQIIKEMSLAIEEGGDIRLLNLSIQENRIEIRGEGSNIDLVEKLEKKLKASVFFEDIKITNIQMNQIKNLAEFTIDMKLA